MEGMQTRFFSGIDFEASQRVSDIFLHCELRRIPTLPFELPFRLYMCLSAGNFFPRTNLFWFISTHKGTLNTGSKRMW